MQQDLRIFLAAVYTNHYMMGGNRYPKLNPKECEVMKRVKDFNILESYHYVNKPSFVNNMRDNNAKVFLDSGAFSSYMLGVEIDLPTYCNYIIENKDIIRNEDGVVMASVLDGIGDPQLTYDNQQKMEKLGAKPLPCFHAGEEGTHAWCLEEYVANYDYITLGGMVGASNKALEVWLDRIFENFILDGAGRPKTRVHGFGITSRPLMERYPWYSCDSSSWIQSAAFGAIEMARHGPIQVSSKSPARHHKNQHLSTMQPNERYALECELYEKGFGYERLSTVYESRAVCNMLGYMELQDMVNAKKPGTDNNMRMELF